MLHEKMAEFSQFITFKIEALFTLATICIIIFFCVFVFIVCPLNKTLFFDRY